MRGRLAALLAVLAIALLAPAAGSAAPPRNFATPSGDARNRAEGRHLAILCYHDVSNDSNAPGLTVSPEFLRRQIRASRAAGWTFVSLQQVIESRSHPERLPPRALVMTFDDGYRSFRELALPILRAERVPVTLAVITGFVEQAPPGMAPLLNWDELNELASDSLVTLVSHSHHLHRYDTSNPYRDTNPSVASRRYILAEARYENREEYRARVRADLDSARSVFHARLHHDPAVLVWPYGAHNEMARSLAAQAGFALTLALGGGEVSAQQLRDGCLPRIMVNRAFGFDRGDDAWLAPATPPVRAANVDLDDVYSRDPRIFDERVNQLVARVRAIGANTVFLSVCSDSTASGQFAAAWYMNHQVHTRADIWSMVAARLSQSRIKVWARVPTLNLSWVWRQHPEWRIGETPSDPRERAGAGTSGLAARWPNRLAPDLPESRRAAIDFLTDLAVYTPLDGVVFGDDAAMAANERLALAGSKTARDKATAIDDLVGRCRDAVRAWRPDCAFARVVEARVVATTGADASRAQDFTSIVRDNDLCVVSVPIDVRAAAKASSRRIGRLGNHALARGRAAMPRGAAAPIAPVLLELLAFDATSSRWLDPGTLRELKSAALRAGIANIGVSPVSLGGDLPAGLLDLKPAPNFATGDPGNR